MVTQRFEGASVNDATHTLPEVKLKTLVIYQVAEPDPSNRSKFWSGQCHALAELI